MAHFRRGLILGLFFAVAGVGSAQEPPKKMTSAELAAFIDRMIEAKWAQSSAQPAPNADDADFLRRVSLDLMGRVPRVSEVRAFLDNPSADKRAKTVEEMLSGSPHVVAMGNFYKALILPNNNNQAFAFQNPQFKSWIEDKIRSNVPYNEIVDEVISGNTGAQPFRGGLAMNQPTNNTISIGAQSFYFGNENKPENLASAVTRTFLGVRLECAQCHDHPFASWKKKQFWELAAFFPPNQQPRFENGKIVQPAAMKPRQIKIPQTDIVVEAKFLDGGQPKWLGDPDPRKVLSMWITSKNNPYFAKSAVNRLWAHFFGLGLAEPIDDEPTDDNPVSHPELLDEIANQFMNNEFDVKYLIRAFVLTKTYQRSSLLTHPTQADARLWARMPVRGLSAEQLFDSLVVVVGYRDPNPQQQFAFNGPRFDFLNRFASTDRKTDKQTSILQALSMMNGKFIADATDLKSGNTLAAIADAPFLSTTQKIETMFLATLGRMPRSEEMERFESYVARGGSRDDAASALADVFWVLLNSSEFALNR